MTPAALALLLAGELAGNLGVPAAPTAAVPRASAVAVSPARRTDNFPDAFVLGERLVLPLPGTDYDRDGLVDEAEARLAEAFRPYFVFDSLEDSLLPGEPVTLFQVRPIGCSGPPARCGGAPLRLAIVYVSLWKEDGGYPHILGIGSHTGDNQVVSVEIEGDASQKFRIVSIGNGGFHWPKYGARFRNGTHPWIYFSAGKHHQFFDTSFDGRASPMSVIFPESLDGKGPAFMSTLRGNAGEPDAPRYWRIGPLDSFGFPGEHAFGGLRFCGGDDRCDRVNNGTATMRSRWRKDRFFVPAD